MMFCKFLMTSANCWRVGAAPTVCIGFSIGDGKLVLEIIRKEYTRSGACIEPDQGSSKPSLPRSTDIPLLQLRATANYPAVAHGRISVTKSKNKLSSCLSASCLQVGR